MNRERERAEKRIGELEGKLDSARDMLIHVRDCLRWKSTPTTRAEIELIKRLGYEIDDAKSKPYPSSPYTSHSLDTAHEYQPCAVCDESTHYENIWESEKGLVCKECHDEQHPEENEGE